jgi:hypothetical protein
MQFDLCKKYSDKEFEFGKMESNRPNLFKKEFSQLVFSDDDDYNS